VKPLVTTATPPVPASTWDPYLSLRDLASYSSLSERLLRSFLTAPSDPLPHFRVGGRVLVRRSDFDRWIEVYREPTTDDADAIATRMLAGLDDGAAPASQSPRPLDRREAT
jgi:hypothetical protein